MAAICCKYPQKQVEVQAPSLQWTPFYSMRGSLCLRCIGVIMMAFLQVLCLCLSSNFQ